VRKDVASHTIYIFTAAVPHNMQIKELHTTVILSVVIQNPALDRESNPHAILIRI